jgi:dTDP-4-amino-4,6-dideoxygalactose transaminase
MLNTSFSSWPSFTVEEADAVRHVVMSNKVNYWTGTETREFEKEFAAWCGTAHAVALANGTLALDVALKALGVGPGDEVVVTPRTFIASISCVVNTGAVPVFADVEADSGNISAHTIAAVLSPRTKAVVCVHLAGWPCDMDSIMALAAERGLKVIEDCAQAHGARYKGRPVGSIGHVGAWSFCQDKIMTTGGEGGMVTTNDEALWRAMWSFKDHGKSYEAVYEREHPPGFRWLHESFGTNWRMLEMQAVIGRIQLRRMAEWTRQRQANAARLSQALLFFVGEGGAVLLPNFGCASCPGPCGAAGCEHAQYKFYVYLRPENLAPGWSRDRIIEAINSEGVPCYQGSCSEVYLEKAFDDTGWRPSHRLPVARELGETSLMFLVHPTLTEAEISKTSTVIQQVMSQASKN